MTPLIYTQACTGVLMDSGFALALSVPPFR